MTYSLWAHLHARLEVEGGRNGRDGDWWDYAGSHTHQEDLMGDHPHQKRNLGIGWTESWVPEDQQDC